ncbi:MAG: ACT domain-containing protein [Clostridia bacterium]|nr:ACT domain-containing protein [Clostridia bacterium]
MVIERLTQDFSICKVADYSLVDWESAYCFIAKTDEENSLVCVTEDTPANATDRDDGWRAFRIQGILDFSLVGVLSKISALLAESGIGLFAVSTFQTDYILTKADCFDRAAKILIEAGYEML